MNNHIEEIYTDGIGKIHFLGGMLRLDLFSFLPTENEGEKPSPEVVKRLIMSPNAFLASYESFVNMIEKLKEAGIIATNSETNTNETTNTEESVKVEDTPAE